MSVGAFLGPLVVEIGREAVKWAVDRIRGEAAKHGVLVDDETIAIALRAELTALCLATDGIVRAFTPLPVEERTVPPLPIDVEVVTHWTCSCGAQFDHLSELQAHITASGGNEHVLGAKAES